jgi:hypothetical protein
MPKRKPASRRRKPRPAQTLPAKPHKTPFARELATKRRGEISELAFALAAARSGFGIAKPFGDSERYDIILDCRNNDCCDLDCRDLDCRDLDSRDNDPSHLNPSRHPPVRPRLVRVQVKSSTQLLNGLYHVNAGRRINGRAVPYKLSEIDFIAAYIIPEDSWFILPLPHILGQTSLLFRPKLSPLPGLYDAYRNAWHLLREPDGLEFA